MTLTAVLLVLVSAAMHAGWNLLGKRQSPSLAFFLLAMSTGGLLWLPVLAYRPLFLSLSSDFWQLLVLSGAFQSLYMTGLAWAYARGDISVLYPLGRSLPVLMVPVASFMLWQTLEVGPMGWLGMALIATGSVLLPLITWRDLHLRYFITPALGLIGLAALGTTGYTLVDKAAIDRMNDQGYSPILAGLHFMVLQAWAAALWMMPIVLCLPKERASFRTLLRQGWTSFTLAGIMILSTYGLVLVAMSFTREVSYLLALRQASVPMGALAGIYLLREGLPPLKLAGLICMVTGLTLIALI